jgi:hypothetical protein
MDKNGIVEVIQDKIYCNQKGEFEGWGLKIFP